MENEKLQDVDVSIIIISWNTMEITCDCLRSIYELTKDVDFEVIVVDNGSTDDSCEVVEEEFPQVKLIKNGKNLGFSKANNIGIKVSTGRYLFLVNSDIIILDACVKKMIQFMDKNPHVGMAGPRILNPDMSLQPTCKHYPSLWNNFCQALGLNRLFPKSSFFSDWFMSYWQHDTIKKVDGLGGCFLVVRRKALDEVGLLDEDFFIYGEDIDWCRRFNLAGWNIMFNSETEAIHFGGASSSNAPIRFYLEMQKADLQYWRKHHGRSGRVIYAMIIVLGHLLRLLFASLKYVLSRRERESSSFKLKRSLACIRYVLFKRYGVI